MKTVQMLAEIEGMLFEFIRSIDDMPVASLDSEAIAAIDGRLERLVEMIESNRRLIDAIRQFRRVEREATRKYAGEKK